MTGLDPARAGDDAETGDDATAGGEAQTGDDAPAGDDAPSPVLLDARGQRCPMPVIRLGALLKDLPPGAGVLLLATDPAARTDVPAFCRMRRHDLVEVTDEGTHTAYLVRHRG
ncbi:sulfurtransferase TusA family protein [Lapillicoccus sp.]|uniref:sulfurtransferase TusA family protein n=1 Tax=Lapillicoccus sp. TaxID=1909287 RepID=UPI003983D60C